MDEIVEVGLLLPTMGWVDVEIAASALRGEDLAETIRFASSTETSINVIGGLTRRAMSIQGRHIIAWSTDRGPTE